MEFSELWFPVRSAAQRWGPLESRDGVVRARPRLGAGAPVVHLRPDPRRVVERPRHQPVPLRRHRDVGQDGEPQRGRNLRTTGCPLPPGCSKADSSRPPCAGPLKAGRRAPRTPSSCASGSPCSGTPRSSSRLRVARSRTGRQRRAPSLSCLYLVGTGEGKRPSDRRRQRGGHGRRAGRRTASGEIWET